MRKRRWFLTVLILIWLVGLVSTYVLAEDEIEADDVYDDWYPFSYKLAPRISYNPLEYLRLGGAVRLNGLFGSDEFELASEYSFYSQRFNTTVSYMYIYDNNYFYLDMMDDLESEGIYNKDIFWQHKQSISLGATREQFYMDDYYVADLMIKFINRDPARNPAGLFFDTGPDLMIHPSIFGTYQGYMGNLEMIYGAPLSDYHYLKIFGMLKKAYDITNLDRFIISAQGGYIGGTYPLQQEFFLGSSGNNIFPNFKPKFQSLLNGVNSQGYQVPEVTLDGYWDRAFYGDKMYTVRLEYQRRLAGEMSETDEMMDLPFNLVGKVYGIFGNAWEGDFQKGFEEMKPAIGVGLHFEPTYLKYFEDKEIYAGINLTRGFGDQAATTFGFELGTTLQFLDIFNF